LSYTPEIMDQRGVEPLSLILGTVYSTHVWTNFVLSLSKGNEALPTYLCLETYLCR